ncbi:hypothetical protein BCR26_11265 [Enterococcus rivorum]|uniref:Choline/carnitine acyltransferase domain-containing protein n=3 Tax=Enterococcus rivorum TaxID=762845 RepID=A0A1E5KZ19_9ENTE|nr:hypothetical protein BCR26_11265 [Enterococcus rivorum]
MKKYQEDLTQKLKKLPLSNLDTTLSHILEWSKPVLTLEEFQNFKNVVEKFSINEGPKLQNELQNFMNQSEGSWLSKFWLEGYLSGRGPVQSETNFALVINPYYHEKIEKVEVKMGMIIYQLTKIYKSFVEGTFPLEQTKSGQYIDMSFYANFFKSIRLPDEDMDHFYRGEAGTVNNFILIVKNGHYFKLYVTDETGSLISLKQLVANIQTILAIKLEEMQKDLPIHYLSAIDRKESSALYTELMKKSKNRENFETLADSLFVVSFNEFSDEGKADRIKNMLLHPENQFFSKTMQLLVTKNGSVGFNFEHSAIDGVPTLTILDEVIQAISQDSEGKLEVEVEAEKATNLFSKLEWEIPEELIGKMNLASRTAALEVEKFSMTHHVFNQFGKEAIKKAGVSPDAFFHIALVMAQYEVTQNFKSIYEPVAMRAYYQGRTESARPMSVEKRSFVEAFFAENRTPNTRELEELFKVAALAHGERIALCQSGKGVERHLFGLKKMAEMKTDKGINSDYFFLSEGMKAIQSDFISTTGIPYDILESFSFAPVNQEGFGLYYGLLADRIVLDISSRQENERQSKELLKALCNNLVRLSELTEAKGK